MRKLIWMAALFGSSMSCLAAPDEEVVEAMTKLTSLTAEEIRQDYDACDSGVTLRMKICASYHWVAEDVRLNKIYAQVRAKAKEVGYSPRSLRLNALGWPTGIRRVLLKEKWGPAAARRKGCMFFLAASA